MDVVLGLSIKGGVLFYGAATPPGEGAASGALAVPVANAPDRLEPATALDGSKQLADFAQRFRQDVRTLSPERVGLVATRQHSNWLYKHAAARIGMAAAVMLVCEELGIPFDELKTERIAKVVKLPAHKLETLPYAVAGFTSCPVKWAAGRAEAFAAAITLLASA